MEQEPGTLHLDKTADQILDTRTAYCQRINDTPENLERLLGHVGAAIGTTACLADFQFVKAYVRHADDLAFAGNELRGAFGPDTVLRLLNVDTCRSDLLVPG